MSRRQRLRLGLLGTGVAARRLYLPALAELEDRLELVACANRTAIKARRFAEAAGGCDVVEDLDALLNHPRVDAILVSLPIDQQPEYVRRCLRAGRPVLSEKPIAPTLAEGRRLVKFAGRHATPWLVGENYEFMRQLRQAARWIARGRLGQVRVVDVRQMTLMGRSNPYFSTSWRQQPKHVGGFIVDGGVHLAHAVRRCFGTPRVRKKLTSLFDPALAPVDTALALLEFPSGAVGTWTSCFAAAYQGPMLTAYGSKANLSVGYDWAEFRSHTGKVARVETRDDSFALELSHFADVVLRGKPPAVSPADALGDLELIVNLI